MESKNVSLGLLIPCILSLFFVPTTCDINKDKEKCANQLVGVATCLPYVSGQAKAPPMDCCTGFKEVLQKSPECICLLIKDRDDPSLGLKIIPSLALGLPDRCNAPANKTINNCPAILHLPPNSPDAKVFEDFANGGKKSNSTTPSAAANSSAGTTTTTANQQSDGGKREKFLGIEMFSGLLPTIVAILCLDLGF
ncbi:hypothetical protein CDL12_22879 [Handroanthus impetiginosus]|uniref:Bifunctional inhibitor/plant lipid transfer protein/seed storage helical domain-containing protein n=1 Tax=Handroanthus impetiginosus TaxID=429701 RepID=A0A2G9GH07_9LAMI|nr:hypothetical protein CDL12_22879 [Handroanthus impetiginosus]